MALEYAIDSQFSIKSDVFNFVILLLEILSGKKNRASFHLDQNLNLVGHVSSQKRLPSVLHMIRQRLIGNFEMF